MITVTFPDGAQRVTTRPARPGLDIAKGISPSLAKRTVAMARRRRRSPISPTRSTRDARLEFLDRDDPRALELIRHDAAHVLAEAVQALYPGTQVTIGPVIEDGFYYDFYRETPFTPEDFAAIEAKMREIIARDRPFTKEVWSRDEARAFFEKKGEAFKVELVDAIPADQDLKIYRQGDWLDLCRGPHMTSTGKIGTAFKLMKVAGAYWRGDSTKPDAVAHLRHGLRQAGRPRRPSQAARGGRQARPPPPRPRDGPVPLPGGGAGHDLLAPEGLDAVPDADRLHAPPPGGGRLHRGQHAAGARPGAVGDVGPLADLSREHVRHARPRTSASSR